MKKFKDDLLIVGKDIVGGAKFIAKYLVLPVWWIGFVVNEKTGVNDKNKPLVRMPATQLTKMCCVKYD